MAYTYGNWASLATATLQLAALNLHIAEVTDLIGKEEDAGNVARSSHALQRYLNRLFDERTKLEAKADIEGDLIPGAGKLKAILVSET